MKYILVLIFILDLCFIRYLLQDVKAHRGMLKEEPGNPFLLAVYEIVLYFGSTFGISDFAISSAVFSGTGTVSSRNLPGTLIAQSVIPCMIMSVGYLSFVRIDLLTLLLPMAAQLAASCLGPRVTLRLSAARIRLCVSVGLFIAAVMMLLSRLSVLPSAGDFTVLRGWRLFFCILIAFFCGILNNIGIGAFSVMLALLYAVGLNQLAAYPIMMGAAAISTPVGSIQFIKAGQYHRKLCLIANIFGSVGALFAILVVKSINLAVLQWIIIFILFYSSVSTWLKIRKG